ncbi:MAG TPA: hypothetical protein VH877_08190 [Polyangia bacterium]|nr:hypothetical protein [Polyangia bacterium]
MIQRLDPGHAVDLDVTLYSSAGTGSEGRQPDYTGPRPRHITLDLILRDAFGNTWPFQVPLDVHAPWITLTNPRVHTDRQEAFLIIDLSNAGNQDSGDLDVAAEFWRAGHLIATAPRQQLPSLQPAQTSSLSFPIPQPLRDRQRFDVHLTVRGSIWPSHVWPLIAPDLHVGLPIYFYVSSTLLALILAAGLIVLRLYRDPTVVKVARAPEVLRSFPLHQLPTVDRALRRTGRLDGAITINHISHERWTALIDALRTGPDTLTLLFARAIGATRGARLDRAALPAWHLHLPSLDLRFGPETTLAVLTGPALEDGPARQLADAIFDNGRGPSVALALDLTDTQRAAQLLHSLPRVAFVTLTADQLRDLLFDERPERHLIRAIAAQRPVAELSPYQTGGAIEDDALFVGRERELRVLGDRRPRNHFLVGGRQMGKSTLLKALERRIKARGDVDVSYAHVTGDDLAATLRDATQQPLAAPADLRRLAGTRERPHLWLLDEVDRFITVEATADYPWCREMRALAEEGRAYFILAGYWTVYRAAVLEAHSPLRNFGEVLRLGPLDRAAAHELATRPMAALGLGYDPPALVDQLLAETGCRANLIAIACASLIDILDAQSRVYTQAQLDRVLFAPGFNPLRQQLQYWREIPLDRQVVRAALGDPPTPTELAERLRTAAVPFAPADLEASLERLELGYVLIRGEDGRLRIPVPLLQRMVEEEAHASV